MNKQEIEENIAILESIVPEYEIKNRMFGVKALRMAISALTQQLNDGWIPVDSGTFPELPKEWIDDGFNRISVLVTTEYEDASVIRWYDIEDKAFYDDFDSLASRDFGVEAWMYLPEAYMPYKEVSE